MSADASAQSSVRRKSLRWADSECQCRRQGPAVWRSLRPRDLAALSAILRARRDLSAHLQTETGGLDESNHPGRWLRQENGPLSCELHKTVPPTGGQTVLGRVLDALIENDGRESGVVTGHRDDQLRGYMATEHRARCVTWIHCFPRNQERSGQGGSGR